MKYLPPFRSSVTLVLLVLVVSATAGILLFDHNRISFIFFGDAVSHLVRTRQIIDSLEPGLINLGTVWLPLPHLLLLPAAAVDRLFLDGIAGAFIGIPLLAGTGVLLFAILRTLTGSRTAAFAAALLFILNPNVVYIALTPMNEIPLLFFLTLGGFALQHWLHSRNERWMLLCGAAVFSASLCRYEAWLLVPFMSVIALYHGMLRQKEGNTPAAFSLMLAALLSCSGIMLWLGWNWFVYNDPFTFLHWTYAVGRSTARDTLADNPLNVLALFGKAVLWIFGPMMIAAGLFLLLFLKKIPLWNRTAPLLLFLLLPVLFNLAAVYAGFVQMDEWMWNWRFVLTAGIPLSAASALLLSEFRTRFKSAAVNTVMIVCFAATPAVQLAVPSIGTVVYKDAKKSFDLQSRSASAVGEAIGKSYTTGTVSLMTGYGYGQRIMISSRLPLKTFLIHYFPEDSIPDLFCSMMVIGKQGTTESDDFSAVWPSHRQELLRSHSVVMENSHFVLLRHRSAH